MPPFPNYPLVGGKANATAQINDHPTAHNDLVAAVNALQVQLDLAPLGKIGYAQAVAPQATITTEADLTGLSVTVNVAAGRRIRVSGYVCPFTTVANDVIRTRIKADGAQVHGWDTPMSLATTAYSAAPAVTLTPSAGSHTYKLTMHRAAGTGSVTSQGDATNPAFILVEDLGPA